MSLFCRPLWQNVTYIGHHLTGILSSPEMKMKVYDMMVVKGEFFLEIKSARKKLTEVSAITE